MMIKNLYGMKHDQNQQIYNSPQIVYARCWFISIKTQF